MRNFLEYLGFCVVTFVVTWMIAALVREPIFVAIVSFLAGGVFTIAAILFDRAVDP